MSFLASSLVETTARGTVSDTLEQLSDVSKVATVGTAPFRITKLPIRLRFHGDGVAGSKFDSADVSSFRSAGTAIVLFPISKQLGLRLTARGGGTVYDFDGDKQFIDTGRTSGDPFDDLIENSYSLDARYVIDETWAVIGSGFLTSRFEDGASYGSGIQGGGLAGGTFSWKKKVLLIAGIGLSSRMTKSGVRVSPFIQGVWNITDRYRLESDGLGARFTAKINDSVRLFAVTGFEGKRYRLDDRGGTIGKGTIRDRSGRAGAGIEYRFGRGFRIRTELGSLFYHQLKVGDDHNDTVDTENSHGAAFYGMLRVEFRFRRR